MISDDDVTTVAAAARLIPPAVGEYLETDFIMNLLETVVDYMMHTTTVERALNHFRTKRWSEVRTIDDLDTVLARFPNEKDGNILLAQYLWGYKLWTRAEQLRGLSVYFRSIGVINQPTLKAWATRSTFRSDFEGRVHGLGLAVYQWLVMRQGVETVKPDVHLRRFSESVLARRLTDTDVINVVERAARELKVKAYELDWSIWEAQRSGTPVLVPVVTADGAWPAATRRTSLPMLRRFLARWCPKD